MAHEVSRPLKRSRSNRMLAGVCGGIANWLGWDPTVVRVAYVLSSILSAAFPGLLAYVILWFVMPEDDFVMENVRFKALKIRVLDHAQRSLQNE